MDFSKEVSLIWNIAELLRGSWKQYEYQDVILPFVVLKRLDSEIAPNKDKILKISREYSGKKIDIGKIIKARTKLTFYNLSNYDFERLVEEPTHIKQNFKKYLSDYSENVTDILDKFDFNKHLTRLEGGEILYLIIKEFNKVDLHPDNVTNEKMGYIFEELIRKFNEQSNETAGEHYTPREVIEMMVDILLQPDKSILKKENKVITVYDCACGTGGMLTVSKNHILNKINEKASVYLFGQELNPISYAICKSDMLIKGEDTDRIKGGDKDNSKASTLANDQFSSDRFDYCLTNPPYGVDWKKDKEAVEREAERRFSGRFGAGLPRISDGQLLFVQHMISKMKNTVDGGSRIAIVLNGSPLFTGDAGSGESEIRRWILEHDWLEAIIALPDQLFYNTGINTYVWIITNRKDSKRKNKVQLIDARTFSEKMKKSLGNKRNEITDKNKIKIDEIYNEFKEGENCRIINYKELGYRQITVERPLKLNFSCSKERIDLLRENDTFKSESISKKKGKDKIEEDEDWAKLKKVIFSILNGVGDQVFKKRDEFIILLEKKFNEKNIKVPQNIFKTILNELSERDETAEVCRDSKGRMESDSELRDTENVPLGMDIREYFDKEVKPYAPDAWINEEIKDETDKEIGKVGYEIPFTRFFYKYVPPRDLNEIEKDIEEVENELLKLLKEI